MNRPYIICHMVMSLDAKVTGNFLSSEACVNATKIYYELNRELKSNGFICGRVTMEESFTKGAVPELQVTEPFDGREDYITDVLSGFYAVAFDTRGRLGWKAPLIEDDDPGYGGAQIVEVLSKKADSRYLSYLRKLEIPYIIAGEDKTDVKLALKKLKENFGCETLLLEGGSEINGAFIEAGVIDELSLVVVPVTAGNESKPLFSKSLLSEYELVSAKPCKDVLVLRYKRK